MDTHRTYRRLTALLAVVALCIAVAACEPVDVDPSGARTSTADLDTFSVSNNPTSARGTDVVMRVMNSEGKTKIGYLSFPVTARDSNAADAVLWITTQQSGFTVKVFNTDPFTDATTHATRPALRNAVGTLGRSTAARQIVGLHGVAVRNGRVNLALTTTSLYELEVVSTEGAEASGTPNVAPSLVLGGSTPAATTTTPPTTTPPTTTTTSPPTPPAPPAWKLSFGDEFNGTSVDPTKWNVYDQGKGDSVESPKATTCPRADNVSVGGGKLVMRTQKANGSCTGGQAQSGAGMNTWGRFRQAGGRFEARVRWTAKGNNLWGGFWSHGNGGPGWSRDNPTEIDIFEYIGKTGEPNINRFKPAIHYNYACEGTCGMQNMPYMNHDVTAWHTYAIEWEPTNRADPTTMQIRFYVDGVLITVFDKAGTWQVSPSGSKVLTTAGGWQNPKGAFPNPFGLDREHQIILSAWVGAPGVATSTINAGYNPPGGHADLEVDYVRVYKRP